jgi:hypothetical protein
MKVREHGRSDQYHVSVRQYDSRCGKSTILHRSCFQLDLP